MFFRETNGAWNPWYQDDLPIEDGTIRSFWPYVYDRLLTGNDAVIRTVTLGVGGSMSSEWINSYVQRFGYARGISKIDYVFWIQGEGDAGYRVSKSTYKNNMRTLKNIVDTQYFSQLSQKPKWVLFKSTGGSNINLTGSDPYRDAIRNAINELVQESPQDFLL
jgi:hypothetical protein